MSIDAYQCRVVDELLPTFRDHSGNGEFSTKTNQEMMENLICLFLDCGRKEEYPERTPACTGRA